MDALPFEIILQIFIALSLIDRVQMMIGLREWKARLNEYLLYSINCDSESQDFTLYNRYSQEPFYRDQLMEFTMTLRRNNNFNTRHLLLHPNLRIIKLTANYGFSGIRQLQNNIEQAVAMPQVVFDFHYCELTRQMMHSNLGIMLHTLVLDFCHVNTNETSIVMESLQNLPQLRHLVFDNPTFRVIYLEALHNNLPGLTSIELNNVHLSRGPTVTNVLPALNITRAHLSYGARLLLENFEVYEAFRVYTIAKYPLGRTLNPFVSRD